MYCIPVPHHHGGRKFYYFGIIAELIIVNMCYVRRSCHSVFLLILALLCFIPLESILGQNVTPAENGEGVSADDAVLDEFTTLDGPVITETDAGQLQENGTIIFSVPDDFIWDEATIPSVEIDNAPGAGTQDTQLEIEFVSISETEIEFVVTESSIGPSPPTTQPGEATFENFNVRPSDGILPAEGEIHNIGTTAPGGNANYGKLSAVEGDPAQIRVETEPDGSGEIVPETDMQAGDQLEVFAIVTDLPGNFLENAEADQWSLINVTGELTGAELTSSADNTSAVFEPVNTGSAQIESEYQGLQVEPSGIITVESADPNQVVITQQPSDVAEAGQPFDQQPVVEVRDAFDNMVTQSVVVEAKVASGEGMLQGTTEEVADDGEVAFNDLFHEVAGEITIAFSYEDLNEPESGPVQIEPGPPDGLIYEQQPTNTTVNEIIIPSVDIGIVDEFGNRVAQQDITIDIEISEGSGSLSGTLSRDSNADGLVEFDDLAVNITGEKKVTASNSGLGQTESETFLIMDEGELAGFDIESASQTPISDQTAGEAFDIRITARDGSGNLVDDFNDEVTLGSNAGLAGGEQQISLEQGVADDVSIALETARTDAVVTAEYTETIDGQSNEFEVQPAAFDPDESVIDAAPQEITADGISTSVITVEIRDEFGNRHTEGGDNVDISTTAGTLTGSVTDNNDGSYEEELTASNTTETATISATVNAEPLTSTIDVAFVHGALAEFRVSLDGGADIPDHIAGESNFLEFEALDNHGNRVTSFDETVEVSSDAELGIGEGTSGEFTDGLLISYEVQVITTGTVTIDVQYSNGPESGSSNSFTVTAAEVDADRSTVAADPGVIESDGESTSEITISSRDEFGNIRENESDNVSATTTAGTLGAVQDNGDGTYTTTLTSSTANETAIVEAEINGTSITETAEVIFTDFKIWASAAQLGQEEEWDNVGNWDPIGVPEAGDAVVIPTDPANGDAYPVVEDFDVELLFLEIEAGANVLVEPDNTMTIDDELIGAGTLIMDANTILTVSGDKTLQSLNAGSADVIFNAASGTQIIENNASIGRLELLDPGGTIMVDGTITVESELLAQTDVELSDETILNTGGLTINEFFNAGEAEILVSGDITNNGTGAFSESDLHLNASGDQQFANLGELGDLTIETDGVADAEGDVIVTGSLSLNDGILDIDSGNSLVAIDQSVNGGQIRMNRVVDTPQGWRTMASPLESNYGDFMDGTISQGFDGATYPDLQPNILWYLEHEEGEEGLDLERWRAPDDETNTLQPGRGHLVYFFDDVPEDDRYNQPLPHTIQVTGTETAVEQEEFDFEVTYTAEADTGWNLVANPYASAIDWDSSFWTKTNMDETIYIWDSSANGGEGDYLVWNGINGSLDDGIIAPFQAFWVKADLNPELTVNKNVKQAGGEFLRSGEEPPPSITLTGQAEQGETTFAVTFSEDGRYLKDRRDAYRLAPLSGNALHMYTVREDGAHLVMKHLPVRWPEPIELPLYVDRYEGGVGVEGTFEITGIQMEHIPDSWSIEWHDTQANESKILSEESEIAMEFTTQEEPVHFGQQAQINQVPLRLKGASGQNRYSLVIQVDLPNQNDVPEEFALNQNYPNPFNNRTTIPFAIAETSEVHIELFDVMGRKVKTLVSDSVEEGFHEVQFNAGALASGVYLYRMKAGTEEFVRKLTLIK